MRWDDAFRADLIDAGQRSAQPEHLFKPIDDAAIAAEVERLHAMQARRANQSAPSTVRQQPQRSLHTSKPNISFDDFSKLDLRVGTITAAESVAKADKLLKLTIDIGEATPRTRGKRHRATLRTGATARPASGAGLQPRTPQNAWRRKPGHGVDGRGSGRQAAFRPTGRGHASGKRRALIPVYRAIAQFTAADALMFPYPLVLLGVG